MSEFQTLFTVIERCCPFSSLLSSSSLSACKCLSICLPALLSLCIVLYSVPLPQNVIMIIFQESGASRGAKVSTNQQYNTGTGTHTHTHPHPHTHNHTFYISKWTLISADVPLFPADTLKKRKKQLKEMLPKLRLQAKPEPSPVNWLAQ